MNYQAIKADLTAIAELFKLGAVTNVRTQESSLKGYSIAQFSTEKEQDLKYYFKTT